MERNAPKYLKDHEIESLLKAPDIGSASGLRNLAIIMLMLDAGCKVSEIVGKEKLDGEGCGTALGGLRVKDIDWENSIVRVYKTKQETFREIPISADTHQVLKKWISLRPRTDNDFVFTTLEGTRIQNRYVRQFLSRYAYKAGIEKPVKPSMLRHTYAKKLYQQSRNIELVRERLGHVDLSTTAVYTVPEDE